MIYDVAPGVLIETPPDRLLDEDELELARRKYEKGTKIETIAKALGATVFEQSSEPVAPAVAVPYDALVATVGEEKARELIGSHAP